MNRSVRHGISLFLGLTLSVLSFQVLNITSASASTTSFSSSATVSPPTPNSYSGSAGGDGWGLAFTQGDVYNVFHHQSTLQVACHVQATGDACTQNNFPLTVTDDISGQYDGDNFATSSQPTVWINQATGYLYVYASATPDDVNGTAGVVCVDTTSSSADPFCGFTPLSAFERAPLQDEGSAGGISNISDGVIYGNNFYAVNFVSTTSAISQQNGPTTMMCFSLTTFAACANQPFNIDFGGGNLTVSAFPAPTIALTSTEIIIPFFSEGLAATDGNQITCFDTTTDATCAGSWPIADPSGLSQQGPLASTLNTVSCASPGNCTAVGVDQTTQLPDYSVEVADNWGPAIDFNDASATLVNATLQSISCVDANDCVAVGWDSNQLPIVIAKVAGIWQAPEELSGAQGGFNSVSCTSISACVVVGQDYSSGLPMYAVGSITGSWSDAADVGFIQGSYTAVSCADANDCMVMGFDNANELPMASTFTSGEMALPNDVSGSNGDIGSVDAISCSDANDCVAVGEDYVTGQGWYAQYTGSWGQFTDTSSTDSVALYGVSCSDASQLACVVVGYDNTDSDQVYYAGSGGSLGNIVDTGVSGQYDSVSCDINLNCDVVGSGWNGDMQVSITTWITGAWAGNDGLPDVYGTYTSSSAGGALPLVDPSTELQVGFCMRDSFACFDLQGNAVSSAGATGLSALLTNASNSQNTIAGWEGPATQVGTKIYFPTNTGADCFDFSTDAECALYPITMQNMGSPYSLTLDPNRPGCLWENSDNGSAQIQNFDIYTGSTCGTEGDRFSVSQYTQPPAVCNPLTYSSLTVTSPTADQYTSGDVQFEDTSGNDLGGPLTIGPDGTVDLSSISALLAAQSFLPQFLVQLTGAPLTPVTVTLNWTGTDDPSCFPAPTNAVAPAVSGLLTPGQTVTTTDGTWTNTSGALSYQWYSCAGQSCVAVGTNQNSYTLQLSDVGDTIYSIVTATGLDGTTLSQQSSNTVGPVTSPTYLAIGAASTPSHLGYFDVGQPITLTVDVNAGNSSGSPIVPDSQGTVAFSYVDDSGTHVISTCAQVAPVSGVATCTWTPTASASTYGHLSFTAHYVPNVSTYFDASESSTTSLVVSTVSVAALLPVLKETFRFDSTVLTKATMASLKTFALAIKRSQQRSISITGYASAVGNHQWNLVLCKWRAINSATYLKHQLRLLGVTDVTFHIVIGGERTTSKPWYLNQLSIV